MALPVVIKSGKKYLTLVLDSEMEFSLLLQKIVEKFLESEKFFQNEPIAIMFAGRELSDKEECIILDAIAEFTTVHISGIIDYDEFTNKAAQLKQEAKEKEEEPESDSLASDSLFYIDRSVNPGEKIESKDSIIVNGNVSSGAILKAGQNIIVLGSLQGQAIAGLNLSEDAYIMAFDFTPENFRIGPTLGASLKKRKKGQEETWNKSHKKAQKAFLKDGNIHIERIFK